MWVTVLWSGNAVGLMAVEPEFISREQNNFLEPIPYGVIDTLLSLDTGGSDLISQILLLSHGKSEEWMGNG